MKFAQAIEAVLDGSYIRREGDETIQKIFLVNGSQFQVNRAPLNVIFAEGTVVNYRPHVDCIYSDGTVGVWTPSQLDLFATDWIIVE